MAKTKNKKKNISETAVQKKKLENKKPINPFEVHINKDKQKIIGRRNKADRGLPGVARSKAIKKRKNTLLHEFHQRDKDNLFMDRRIGERNTSMSQEEKTMARFAAERLKSHKKNSIYSLNDEEVLTHKGQTLEEIEKFDIERSDDDFSDDEQSKGHLDKNFVTDAHFGGGILSKSDSSVSRKDLIEQLIIESKKRKAERQKIREQTISLTEKIDTEWKDFHPLLNFVSKSNEETLKKCKIEEKEDYDISMRRLMFEPRGVPSDRLKPEEEIMKEEKEKLEALEQDRLKRMRGIIEDDSQRNKHKSADDLDDEFQVENVDDSDEILVYNEDGTVKSGKKALTSDNSEEEIDGDDDVGDDTIKNSKNKLKSANNKSEDDREDDSADDVEDDTVKNSKNTLKSANNKSEDDREDDSADDIADNYVKNSKKNLKSANNKPENGGEDDSVDDEDQNNTEKNKKETSEVNKEEDSHESEEKSEEDEDNSEDSEDDDNLSDLKNSESSSEDEEPSKAKDNKISSEKLTSECEKFENSNAKRLLEIREDLQKRKEIMDKAREELPYTYESPETSEELNNLLKHQKPDYQSIILERIIKCNHWSLGEENRKKLSKVFEFLLQYVIDTAHINDNNNPNDIVKSFEIFDRISPHLYDLSKVNSSNTATCVQNLLKERHEKFEKNSQIFPQLDTLILFKIVSILFPTSDFRHPVVTPAMIFMSQILLRCKIKNKLDISKGLFVSTLMLEYTLLSKRFSPAVINFLRGIIYLGTLKKAPLMLKIVPPFKKNGKFSNLLVVNDNQQSLKIDPIGPQMTAGDLINEDIDDEFKIRAFLTAVNLAGEFGRQFEELDASYVIFEPIINLLRINSYDNYPDIVRQHVEKIVGELEELGDRKLNYLVMTKKKPKALRLYEPRIERVYDGKKHRPMSKEKAEKEKLMHKLKKEMKGAIREVRRDAAFLAKVQIKNQIKSDMERKRKVKEILSEGAVQQAELNEIKRKKNK